MLAYVIGFDIIKEAGSDLLDTANDLSPLDTIAPDDVDRAMLIGGATGGGLAGLAGYGVARSVTDKLDARAASRLYEALNLPRGRVGRLARRLPRGEAASDAFYDWRNPAQDQVEQDIRIANRIKARRDILNKTTVLQDLWNPRGDYASTQKLLKLVQNSSARYRPKALIGGLAGLGVGGLLGAGLLGSSAQRKKEQ